MGRHTLENAKTYAKLRFFTTSLFIYEVVKNQTNNYFLTKNVLT